MDHEFDILVVTLSLYVYVFKNVTVWEFGSNVYIKGLNHEQK